MLMHVDREKFVGSDRSDQFADCSKTQGFSRVESFILSCICEVGNEAVHLLHAKILQRIDDEKVFEK